MTTTITLRIALHCKCITVHDAATALASATPATLHYTTLPLQLQLHYITFCCATPGCTALYQTTLHNATVHYATLHYATLLAPHQATLHFIDCNPSSNNNYITLHDTTTHYTTIQYIFSTTLITPHHHYKCNHY